MLSRSGRVLILYLTVGDPLITTNLIKSLYQSGVDMLEIGLPTAKPKYDGPVVKRSMLRASANVQGIEEALENASKMTGGGKILFTYYEEALSYGVEELFSRAGGRFYTVLFPDLLIDYPDDLGRYLRLCDKYGFEPAFFVTTGFPHKLVKHLSSLEPAFIYLGLMLSTGVLLPISASRNIRLFRGLVGDVPLIVGFAVRSPEQVGSYVHAGADGVVVGSAFLRVLEEAADEDKRIRRACEFVAGLKKAVENHGNAPE